MGGDALVLEVPLACQTRQNAGRTLLLCEQSALPPVGPAVPQVELTAHPAFLCPAHLIRRQCRPFLKPLSCWSLPPTSSPLPGVDLYYLFPSSLVSSPAISLHTASSPGIFLTPNRSNMGQAWEGANTAMRAGASASLCSVS